MSCRRLAVLSVHSSPLTQPGSGDGGGMSVYVRALASALARAGVECDVLVRREHTDTPEVVVVEPGFRVVQLDAGPAVAVSKHDLIDLVEPMVDATIRRIERDGAYDLFHANYWVSGAVGHRRCHGPLRLDEAESHLTVRQKIFGFHGVAACGDGIERVHAPRESGGRGVAATRGKQRPRGMHGDSRHIEPRLRKAGLSVEQIDTIRVRNPRRLLDVC